MVDELNAILLGKTFRYVHVLFFCQVLKEHIIWRTLRVLCVCVIMVWSDMQCLAVWNFFFGPHLHVCKCRRTHEWHHLQELSGSMVLHSVEARHTGLQLKKPHCNRNYSFTNIFKNIFKIVFKILQDLCSAFYLAGMS